MYCRFIHTLRATIFIKANTKSLLNPLKSTCNHSFKVRNLINNNLGIVAEKRKKPYYSGKQHLNLADFIITLFHLILKFKSLKKWPCLEKTRSIDY